MCLQGHTVIELGESIPMVLKSVEAVGKASLRQVGVKLRLLYNTVDITLLALTHIVDIIN